MPLDTLYKSKLPRGWSYPIGAQALSDALGGVEGAARKPLKFWDYHIRDSHPRQVRRSGQPYPVLEVSYSVPWLEADVEYLAVQGQPDQWEVTINPVPSDKAAGVRRCILITGLSQVQRWLVRTRSLEAREGISCRLLYDEAGGRLLLQSCLNRFEDFIEVDLHCEVNARGAG